MQDGGRIAAATASICPGIPAFWLHLTLYGKFCNGEVTGSSGQGRRIQIADVNEEYRLQGLREKGESRARLPESKPPGLKPEFILPALCGG